MVRVYRSIELSALIALANSVDLFHDQTKEFLDKTKRLGFEPISCKQARSIEMDLAIGVAKRPSRVADALKIIDALGTYAIDRFLDFRF